MTTEGYTPEEQPLFRLDEVKAPTHETVIHPKKHDDPRLRALWTESKARLIQRYLYRFVQVTKHGIYIDGFAGPQTPENLESWAAKLVLETKPPWMRGFFLCDVNPGQVRLLQSLEEAHPDRDVHVLQGDFNRLVDRILRRERVSPTAATFCLLDQRMFECEWATVAKLASYPKSAYKIEIFYFLATGWIDRSLARAGDQKVTAWWGRRDWPELMSLTGVEQATWLARRFIEELEYAYALPLAIHESGRKRGRVMYYMIHASDHPRAPKLMVDAYRSLVIPKAAADQPLPLNTSLAKIERAAPPTTSREGGSGPPSDPGHPTV